MPDTTSPTAPDTRPELPYGSWPSELTAAALTASSVRLSEVMLDGPATFWIETRPQEGGRSVLVCRAGDGTLTDVVPALADGTQIDVRTRAHEYGGASYALGADAIVVSSGADGRLYRVDRRNHIDHSDHTASGTATYAVPVPLTAADGRRYADVEVDAQRGVLYAVCEDHGGPGAQINNPVSTLVAIPLDGSAAEDSTAMRTLVHGTDFVSSPRLSPDGVRLAWLTWNHPNMPWDATTLHVATFAADGTLGASQVLAGGEGDVSVAEPGWTPAGDLVHVSDHSGWWNLYRTEFDRGTHADADGTTSAGPGTGTNGSGAPRTRHLHPAEADFSIPQWGFGPRTWDVLDDDHLVCSWSAEGHRFLGSLRLANGELETWHGEWAPVGQVRASDGRVVFAAEAAAQPSAIVELDHHPKQARILRATSELDLPPSGIAVAESVRWTSTDGSTAHGFYYAPRSAVATGPAGELPPLLVLSHGGPTAAATPGFNANWQFWTSRGFAVLDVNYGGSTGYGRAYRERLKGAWGVVDVADCVSGAQWLAAQGLVDPARLAIRGSSAGGFTTLAALTFEDVFAAGMSRYGIGDLATLAADTHKFESRYLDSLVGPYPADAATYAARSPIHHTDRLAAPMLLLQGLDDRVVPPSQAHAMADAVRAKGLPVALVLFEGEGHGFRQAHNIRAALDAELSFYAQVFGFTPAGDVPHLEIENL